MERALEMATERAIAGAAPFAALVVDADGSVIGEGVNRVVARSDPTAHAEIEALRDAAAKLGRTSLHGHAVIASGEPCAMCAMALRTAGVNAVYFAMSRDQAATAGYDYRSSYEVLDEAALGRDMPSHHRPAPGTEAKLARWSETPATF
ncbi:nucleoside deaminase [Jannaschia seohaensis]|uniref:nucleoside deaminase n=1 Tax=Jannaschia seohaensis TaxID=475081 RepID=UPI001B8650C1|nr:nucleoside deaminase [Jannaschia seohaensis]